MDVPPIALRPANVAIGHHFKTHSQPSMTEHMFLLLQSLTA
jgi:hypothetical protein